MYIPPDNQRTTFRCMNVSINKAVVGGPAGPAMAVPLFFARNGFSRTTFLDKYFFAGPFSHVSLYTSFNDRFCDDQRLIILNDKPCAGQYFVCLRV